MHRLADVCILASGWRRAAIAFIAGALGGLAMPPLGLSFVLFVSFPVAVWLIDGAVGDAKHAFRARLQGCRVAALDGWCFGFGYHVAGLWWVGAAFLVEPDQFAWALPLGVLGLPAVLAVFTAVGFTLARLAWFPSPLRIFTFAAAMTAAEFMRGTLFTGFPWNVYGMALGQYLWTAQVASLVGLYGLTLIVLVAGALPAACVDLSSSAQRFRLWPVLASAVLLAAVTGYGALRIPAAPSPTVPGVKLRIMQPSLSQSARFDGDSGLDLLKSYIELSDRATSPSTSGLADVTHLIWPESPFPFILTMEPRALGMIAKALNGHTVLLTGGIRLEDPARSTKAYNSLFVIGRNGQLADTYDKVHLVPFGEYLPLEGVLRWLGIRQFVELPGGFSSGTIRRTVTAPGLPPVQPLICYEAIFPGEVMPSRPDAPRPGVLLNLTNDAWFGRTAGPYQHWAQARLRSIEEGVPLVRAANSGISGVIDGYGRVLGSMPLETIGVLDSALPRALPITISGRYPALAPFLLWLCIVLLGSASALQRSYVR